MSDNLRALLMLILDKPDDDFFQHIAFEAGIESGMKCPQVERLIGRVVLCGLRRRLVADARKLLAVGHPDRQRMLSALARAVKAGKGCPLRVHIRHHNVKPKLRRYVVGYRNQWPPTCIVTVGAWWLVRTHLEIGTFHVAAPPKPPSLADGWGGYL